MLFVFYHLFKQFLHSEKAGVGIGGGGCLKSNKRVSGKE